MKRIAVLTLALALALVVMPTQAFASIAYPGVITLYDADGAAVSVLNHGDERFSYLTDLSGNLIHRDNSGRYRYVVRISDGYALGERVSGDARLRTSRGGRVSAQGEGDELQQKLYGLYETLAKSAPMARATTISAIEATYDYQNDPLNGMLTMIDSATITPPPARGQCPLLVLMVEFDDIKCLFGEDAWHDRVFVNGVPDYYSHQSNGVFTFKAAEESWGAQNDGVVKVSLPIDMPVHALPNGVNQNKYAGSHTGIYTNGTSRYAIYNQSSLYAYGVAAAAPYVNFAQYDDNGDGFVSPTELSVLVVVAGYEAAMVGNIAGKPMVWAHYWTVNNSMRGTAPQGVETEMAVVLGGTKLYAYTMIGENWNTSYDYTPTATSQQGVQARIGTMCHELGHGLGLMDLYNTSNSPTTWNVLSLSLMGEGNWGYAPGESAGSSPTNLDPYSKTFLGFTVPTVASQPGAYPVYEASNASRYNALRVNTDDPDVYYLVENRTFTGYDRGLDYGFRSYRPGGVVYWRINEAVIRAKWADNAVNTSDDSGIMPAYIPSAQYGYPTPFRNSLSYPYEQSITVRAAPKLTMAVYDATASSMDVHLIAEGSTPPLTGDDAQPVLWIALGALSVGLIAWLLIRWRKKK